MDDGQCPACGWVPHMCKCRPRCLSEGQLISLRTFLGQMVHPDTEAPLPAKEMASQLLHQDLRAPEKGLKAQALLRNVVDTGVSEFGGDFVLRAKEMLKWWGDSEPECAEEAPFKRYRRTQVAELRPYVAGEKLDPQVSVSQADREAGSPKPGDMIARNPDNHADQWLVAKDYFEKNFEAEGP